MSNLIIIFYDSLSPNLLLSLDLHVCGTGQCQSNCQVDSFYNCRECIVWPLMETQIKLQENISPVFTTFVVITIQMMYGLICGEMHL